MSSTVNFKDWNKNHLDIGSRLDGFIAHLLAANIEVTMIDVCEFPGKAEHLHTIVDDATSFKCFDNIQRKLKRRKIVYFSSDWKRKSRI